MPTSENEAVVYLGVEWDEIDSTQRTELMETLSEVDFLPDQEKLFLCRSELSYSEVEDIREFEME